MWVVVEPKESGEEPKCFAGLQVVRRKGWQSLVPCETKHEAEELAERIRQEGFDASVHDPIMVRPVPWRVRDT